MKQLHFILPVLLFIGISILPTTCHAQFGKVINKVINKTVPNKSSNTTTTALRIKQIIILTIRIIYQQSKATHLFLKMKNTIVKKRRFLMAIHQKYIKSIVIN